MKRIKLTQGKFALVDDEDFVKLNKFKWCLRGKYASKGKWGDGLDKDGYPKKILRIASMHAMILGKKRGYEIDHKDGNKLNNQKSNLRFCTRSQNMMNKEKTKQNTTGFKGIWWDKNRKKWQVYIGFNNKNKGLGRFESKSEAAIAYNEAAKKYHGDFARLNTISQ